MFNFPFDHGSHPSFQTEWWYYTGHLEAEAGRRFGYQLTFFRRGVRRELDATESARSKWRINDLYFAHLAVSDLQSGRFHFFDLLSREGLGKAGAKQGGLHVWLDRWSAEMPNGAGGGHRLSAVAREEGIGLDLNLTPLKPLVVHGTAGVSRKGAEPSHTSHYYSLTRLDTAGRLTIDGRTIPVTGLSWMDHEFGSGDLSPDLTGWDWFSMQLDSGEELMLYQLRRADGRPDPASCGTWVDRQGRPRHLTGDSIRIEVLDHWESARSETSYPSRWRVSVAPLRAVLEVTPLLPDQELRTGRSTGVTYWEGAARITGTLGDHATAGRGYVELTGYAEPYRPGQRSAFRASP